MVIKLSKLDITGKDSTIASKEMLDSMPKSKYSISHEVDSRQETDDEHTVPKYETPGSPTNQHNSWMDTVMYWSVEDEMAAARAREQLKDQKWCVMHAHPSQHTANFKFSLHGIWHIKPKYNLYCVARGCNERFYTVKMWNSHYQQKHK